MMKVNRLAVSSVSGFSGSETAEMDLLAVLPDVGAPAISALMPRNALEAGRVVDLRPTVHVVLGKCGLAQIANAVIHSIPVDVINMGLGPATVMHRPYDPMGQVLGAKNATDAITV